ncbi:DUF4215 domain-containing protein [Myxococcota bacterium]
MVDLDEAQGAAGGENPCEGPNPPENCRLVPSGPACGDGELNQDSERCDDNNTLPGDGCSGLCLVEPNYDCPTPGEPCVFLSVCGNGQIEAGEVCDDGNQVDEDGCSATCTIQSASYICRAAGQPCERIYVCGDGIVKGDEDCDDANIVAGDGCDTTCHLESGWICPIPGRSCKAAPRCGDGVLNKDLGEVCDDGNTEEGDGCSGDCAVVQDGWVCYPGEACQSQVRCGDGKVNGDEQCDDSNDSDPSDGCHECQIAPAYECPFPGAPCLAKCGDSTMILNEECDDGNREDGDGCSGTCALESGWVCSGIGPGSCRRTVCNDGTIEGTEGCEDGNRDLGDGCTHLCTIEPQCDGSRGCTSVCGDGLVIAPEVCDDGNQLDGDGCSSGCEVEPTYECKQPTLGDSMEVPVVYRDFQAGGDFEPADAVGKNAAVTGLVQETLDAEGKPVFVGSPGQGYITGAESFSRWYRDVPGTNATFATSLILRSNGAGGYVNRWGTDGEKWQKISDPTQFWCGSVGQEDRDAEGNSIPCTFCPYDSDPSTPQCEDPQQTDCQTKTELMLDCVQHGGTWHGIYLLAEFEGNPVFFPLDDAPDMITPASEYGTALVPVAYDGDWAEEPSGASHNFHFTSEVRYWFEFSAGQEYVLDFTGDDDVWVFINNRLAVDMGGIHTPVNGRIVLNADGSGSVSVVQTEGDETATVRQTVDLGLQDGRVYEIVVFQAERKEEASTYKLTLSGFNASRSKCGPICGDGLLSPGEQCDNGANNAQEVGAYGQCLSDCVRGPYCGDATVQPEHEECDDGVNNIASGCAPGCRLPARCGDGIVQPEAGEECDDGDTLNSGEYGGGCNADCTRASFCGDGEVQAEHEQCDLGTNNGSYGNCNPDCSPAPRCGDGNTDTEYGETCDDGNVDSGDGCSPNCQQEGVCGDAFADAKAGEECDDGVNNGTYGTCAPGCQLPPRCGDGVVQSDHEQCDDGRNAGGYGECAPGCVLGPRCGDELLQRSYEECDDGDDVDTDLCTSACKRVIRKPA